MFEQADGCLYDSANPENRTRLSLQHLRDLPLTNDRQNEIMVYSEDGERIPRREAEGNFVGMLFDLPASMELFSGNSDDDRLDDEAQVSSVCTVYPHAGLRTVGQWQATGVPDVFADVVKELNSAIYRSQRRQPSPDSDDEGVDDNLEELPCSYGALLAYSSQAYSDLAHRYRDGRAFHDAQQGKLTGALLGTYGTTARHATAAETHRAHLRVGLPHQRFESKVKNPDVNANPNSARLENLYVLRYNRLPTAMRNGA